MNYLYLNILINAFVLLKLVLCDHYVVMPYIAPTYFMEINAQFDDDNVLLPLNLLNDFTWISKTSVFNINKNQIVNDNQNITIGIRQHSVQTYKTSFGVSVNRTKHTKPFVDGFHIYIADSPSFRIYQLGVSFAHEFVDPNFSIVDLLYKRNVINERSFSIVTDNVNKNGSVYIGTIPSDITNTKLYKGTCEAFNNTIKWKCKLNKIQIGTAILNLSSNEQMNVEFQTSISRILIPQKIVDFFHHALSPFILNKQCEVNDITHSGQWILDCNKDIIPTLPNFILTIDNFTYSIPFSGLFEQQSGNSYTSLFKSPYEPKETDNNTITLGYTFLSLFDIINFNYEHNTIQLYSKTIPITSTTHTHSSLLTQPLLYILTALITVGIIIDIVVKLKTNINYN